MLYGATCYGGSNDVGLIFRLNTNGADFAVLHSFSTNASDGVNPSGGLIPGRDGAWYGTTGTGGSWGKGMMFRCGTPRSVLCLPCAPDGTFHFSLSSMPGLTYRIDASTNLVNWAPLGELPNPSGLAEFIDLAASNFSRRFYRAVWTPP